MKTSTEMTADIARLKELYLIATKDSATGSQYANSAVQIIAALPSLLAEAERDRKDAERYRWLRKPRNEWKVMAYKASHWQYPHYEQLDTAIDAAMKEPA